MTSRKYRYGKPLSAALALLLVLTTAVCFGQVLGKFYISNISRDGESERDTVSYLPISSRDGAGKIKVLRLNRFEYYSIQAGAFTEQRQAVLLGKSLGEKGLPAVVGGVSPHVVLVGFTNNQEKLLPLAERITVNNAGAVVVKGEVNAVSFKFEEKDTVASSVIAPFLGDVSIALNKGLLLYSGVTTADEVIKGVRPKFAELAREVAELAGRGRDIAAQGKDSPYAQDVLKLAQRCSDWAASISELDKDFQDIRLLVSQQMALALVEDYHRFLAGTN